MGTRADFYIGIVDDEKEEVKGEWIGSIAWSGHPCVVGNKLMKKYPSDGDGFRKLVLELFSKREDWTAPAEGWPWSWKNSQTTDCSYVFDSESKKIRMFSWAKPEPEPEPGREIREFEVSDEESEAQNKYTFPDMTKIKKVGLGKRSGLIILGLK